MQIVDALQRADFILIEGPKKIGKLTLGLFCADACQKSEQILIISAFPKELFKKRLEMIAALKDPRLTEAIESSAYLCAKPNFHDLKIKYGIDYMVEDIRRALLEHESQSLILHRVDMLFEVNEKEMAEEFFAQLVEMTKKHGVKLYATITTDEADIYYLKDLFENLTDISFYIDKKRTVKIKHSIFPIEQATYRLAHEGDHLKLENLTDKTSIGYKNVLLIANNQRFVDLNGYLFTEEKVDLIVAKNFSQALEHILDEPHMTIYDQSDNGDLDLSLCKTITLKHLDTKALLILGRDYIRADDKLLISNTGCFDLLPKNFFVREYLSLVQRALETDFYAKKLKNLHKPPKLTENIQQLCRYINRLYNARIFFSILILKKEAPAGTVATHIREGDAVAEDENRLVIVLLDIRKENIPEILHKFSPFGEVLEYFDALEYKELRTKVCE